MIKPLRFVHFITLLTLAFTTTKAQEVISFSQGEKIMPIGDLVYFLEDKKGKLTLADILQPSVQVQFEKSKEEGSNFANTTSAIWCRFTVVNNTSERCLLQIEKSLIHHIDFFYKQEGTYQSKKTGALHPFSQRDIKDNFFLFHLLPPNTTEPHTFYIRFKTEESLEIPMSIGTLPALFSEHRKEEILSGIFFGLMLCLVLYNLFIYFAVREKFYLYYVFYIVAVVFLIDMIIIGIGFEYIWPDTPQVNFYANALTAVVYITIILFTCNFLDTKKHVPFLHKGLYIFYAACGIIITMNLLGEFFISSLGTQLIGVILSCYLILIAVRAYCKGVLAARFYLLGWGLFLLSGIVYILFLNGLLPSNKFTETAPMIGAAVEGILLSLALADRISNLRREKHMVQREKLQIIEEQKNQLERLITERTHEIVAQNEEIASQNEELVTQQDHITAQNEELIVRNQQLETANKIIEKQHAELIRYSENLEQEINLRAKDLLRSNQELVEQNHQLEQFAFITAHNLRAPVARIQGLATILNIMGNESEREMIIQKMIQSSRELDAVIHDLAKILEIRKGTLDNFEVVDLKEKMERVKSMLEDEITQTEAIINCDFKAASTVFSLAQYIESVLYNLLSNALKYKSPDRRPEISIQTIKKKSTLYLIVKDNGIGVDMARYKEKLFGLYQRFHDHVEGKGLGLHLVKTQVESLGGKIEMQSKTGEGSTFVITLPDKGG